MGCGALALIFLAQQSGWLYVRPPTPPGLRPELVPVVGPATCLFPLAATGSVLLCLLGIRKLLAPDNWRPPKHLGE